MEWISLAMFAVVCLLLMAGYPVALTLGGVGLAFGTAGALLGVFDASFIQAMPNRLFGIMSNDVLLAVPLFVFMGVMLEKSRIAEDLLETMAALFGKRRGGLGISVIIVGALLAASTGIVGATVVTMGLMSLPTMLRRGYSPAVAAGTITAAGTLGQIIPPSITLILLGDVISSAYQQAQLSQGIFSPKSISVGDLFAGALLPGLLLVGLYITWLVIVAIARPDSMPAIPEEERSALRGLALCKKVAIALLPPLFLIVAVLGSILGGIATATEAAAIGALGAIVLAASRDKPWTTLALVSVGVALVAIGSLPVADGTDAGLLLFAGLSLLVATLAFASKLWGKLRDTGRETLRTTSMVFLILIGASVFSLVFRGYGGDELVGNLLSNLPGGKVTALLLVMLVMFLLGFVLDFIEITFVVVPIVGPILLQMGIDPVWLGVMMAMNLQTSFLTPPFGFALFYLRGVAPASVKTSDIYRGVVPFIVIQLMGLTLVAAWPALATWLPGVIYGS